MFKLFALVRDTFRELLVRKVLIGFLVINVLALVVIAVYINADMFSSFAERAHVAVTDDLRTQMTAVVEIGVAAFFEILMIFVSIFATASVVPTLLEKGTLELYLSKPLSRPMLLFGKILGSVAVVAANIAAFIFGAWIILSLKLGEWNPGFLAAGAVMLFTFTVLYGIVVLFNVLTRSGAMGIIVTYVHVLVLSGFAASRETLYALTKNETLHNVLNVLHWILPQTKEHSAIEAAFIAHAPIADWTSIWTSAIYALLLYGAAGWIFARKEF